jgi:hypothetical protein
MQFLIMVLVFLIMLFWIMVLVFLIVSNHGLDHLPLNFNEIIPQPKNAISDHALPTLDYLVLDHGLNHFLLDSRETCKP